MLVGIDWHLCDGNGALVVGHVVVEVQRAQIAAVLHQLGHSLAGVDGAAHILERQPLQPRL